MKLNTLCNHLEIEFGTHILKSITGVELHRNGQSIRLFDTTKYSAEVFYYNDHRGKPYIQNFQTGTRIYPVTAYAQVHRLTITDAIYELARTYGLKDSYHTSRQPLPPRSAPLAKPDYIPNERYESCRQGFQRNGLFLWLSTRFGLSETYQAFEIYRLGTSKHWMFQNTLATTLPQYDQAGNLCQVKVIPFSSITGRRAKPEQLPPKLNQKTNQYEPDPGVWFAGKYLLQKKKAHPVQCYFGLHLVSLYPNKKVAFVEGESTAITASIVYPEFNWLASGGSTGSSWNNPDKFKALADCDVVLWPDSGKFEEWSRKAIPLQGLVAKLAVSDYVEKHAYKSNLDLRDLLCLPQWNIEGRTIYGQPLALETLQDYPPGWDY